MVLLGTMPKPSALVPDGRWSTEEARSVLDLVEHSGVSIQRFAAERGLVAERLYRWKRKLREQAPARFVEVATPTTAWPHVEVLLRSGLVVRVPESSSVEFVGRLVAALEQSGEC
jgi:transposase-like protein